MYLSQQQVRMQLAALCPLLYLVMNCLESGRAGVSLIVEPKRSQFFKYEHFSLSCEEEQREEEEEESTGWRVMKRMLDGEVVQCPTCPVPQVRPCPSNCSINGGFPATDSGEYWCETGLGTTSDTINITVTGGSVILESPVLPVTQGDEVTLYCTSRVKVSDPTAQFYKDGLFIMSSATYYMTMHNVSKSDEGLYKCKIGEIGDSAESRLTVRAPPAGQELPAPPLPVSTLLRHLIVGTPYLLSTILLGLIYRVRKKELRANEARRPSHDVIMQLYA